jgi:hypothetical protein
MRAVKVVDAKHIVVHRASSHRRAARRGVVSVVFA